MRRLYFLIPDINTARKIVDELLLARIEERRIHVIARRGDDLKDMPAANIVQFSDFVPSLKRGLVFGGIAGLIAGLLVSVFFEIGFRETGGLVTLAIAAGGAFIGAWFASLVGISIPNSRLKQFQQAIENGHLLMLVDISGGKMDTIKESVIRHHPEVDFAGVEPGMPAFP